MSTRAFIVYAVALTPTRSAAGNRSTVERLLAEAKRYPATALTRSVQVRLRATEKRADARRQERLLARRERASERRAQARAGGP